MERRKYSVLCCIGFILAVPLQLILITMSYLNRITLSAFTIWVSITLITILLGLVLSIIGVITAKKGVRKGKILGIIGIECISSILSGDEKCCHRIILEEGKDE